MPESIDSPPQKLASSKFKFWYWLLIFPVYITTILWALTGSITSWLLFLEPTNLSILSLSLIIFPILILVWACFKLSNGFQKLAECSQYEVYLTEVFENRERQRPAQNAMRLDYLRKLRKMNSEVRGATENKQKQLLVMAIIGLIILLVGSIGQLVSQLIVS